jgi:hypothetical protein|tara:strand:- start:253 stop:555 length:303 start_codon:yes stop_codon:yes gene_type:complete
MSLHLSTSEFIKDPTSVLDYTFDWTSWLGASENITSSAIVITPASHANNITLDNKTATNKQVTVWLSSGRKNARYTVSCSITTSENRTETASMLFRVLDK